MEHLGLAWPSFLFVLVIDHYNLMRLFFLQATAILLAFTAPLWAAAHLANTLNASPITTHQP